MSSHAKWPIFKYTRRNVRTGVARVAERGFISRREFLGELADWNAQQPDNWQYLPIEPVEPAGYSRTLHEVRDLGFADL